MADMYSDFNGEVFKDSVREALTSVQRVLDVDRSPNLRLAEDIDHGYTDKYKLANLLTNTAIISLTTVFERFGLTKDVLQSIDTDTSKGKATTLRFTASDSCRFVKEEIVDVPLPYTKWSETKEVKSAATELEFGVDETDTTTSKSTIEKIVNRVTQHHYKIETEWEISIYSGTDVDNRRVIKSRTDGASFDFVWAANNNKNSINKPPLPPKRDHDPVELSLTWLLQQIDTKELKSHFAIDMRPKNLETNAITPRRNLQVEEAFSFFHSVKEWTRRVGDRFAVEYPKDIFDRHSPAKSDDKSMAQQNLQALTSNGIFVPVIPLLVDQQQQQQQQGEAASSVGDAIESKAIMSLQQTTDESWASGNNIDDGNVVADDGDSLPSILSVVDTTNFLNEQIRTLDETQRKLKQQYPDSKKTSSLISSVEANIYVLCLHTKQLTDRYVESIQYIEFMLEKQLVAAIGKKVNSADLDKFVRYHNEKMLNPSPKPFCYTIRRPEHYPDGIISIEQEVVDSNSRFATTMEPISTHVRETTSSTPSMKVPLNAATTLELTGKTYLHGWLNHRFQEDISSNSFRLNARARQLSSFVLLVGTLTGHDRMHPRDAIIIRNKDEVNIPLLLNEIPTATEFKDAIGSLSPEQQRFAKAFRSMQLESSVLGVCVIQIKPQLEKLLGLPQHSLTKEMKLTQDLMELFIEYQVPSDLVSYDGEGANNNDDASNNNNNNNNESVKDRVANVKEHVQSVLGVIVDQKKEQLKAQEMATDMAVEQRVAAGAQMSMNYSSNQQMHTQRSSGRKVCKSRNAVRSVGTAAAAAAPRHVAYASPAYMDMGSRQAYLMSNVSEDIFFNDVQPDESSSRRNTTSKFKGTESPSSMMDGQQQQQQQQQQDANVVDFIAMPKILDGAIELHDKDAALRSTTIETSKHGWTRNRQKNMLTKSKKTSLTSTDIASEKSKAFDLLDALSRSGSLAIPFSELHVVVCVTHRFEKNVMETVIVDNINPIEKIEMSTLLMASTIHSGIPARDLIHDEKERERLAASFPRLLNVDVDGDDDVAVAVAVTGLVSRPLSASAPKSTSSVTTTKVDNTAAEI